MKTILVDAVGALVSAEWIYDSELLALLDGYPHRKIVLTGANAEQMMKFGLDRCPYEVFSLAHDPEKTDPAYYRTMLARYGFEASDVVYFEHALAAAESARSVGIPTHLYETEARDFAGLREFLDMSLSDNQE